MAIEGQILQVSRGFSLQLSPQRRKNLGLILAFAIGWFIWRLPPAELLSETGVHFLATLSVAVTLWVLEIFEEYVVGVLLLMSWVVLDIVPSKVALAGFSESSWFFMVAALGIGAAVNKTGLLYRLSVQLLSRVPLACHGTYTLFLMVSGVLATPLLPTGKARTVIALPVSQSISQASGFENRSNGSAALTLSALVGFSQMSFMFLTGGEFCLIGWNLLPASSKSEFGWVSWFVAVLPAGIFTLLFVFAAIYLFLPLKAQDRREIYKKTIEPHLKTVGPLTTAERIALGTLAFTLTGWLTMPLHGINETWIAVAALLVFQMTNILDKNSFKNSLDWGLILFFGIVNSIAAISSHLRVDRWFIDIVGPVLTSVSFGPLVFLAAVIALVCCARLFLRKSAVVTFFTLTLVPLAQDLAIHPGVLLLTILMASECFFLSYQDGPYQIAYSSTKGLAFSHDQARKILLARCIATFAAVAISIPYWRMLGLIGG
jgi:anion transporter